TLRRLDFRAQPGEVERLVHPPADEVGPVLGEKPALGDAADLAARARGRLEDDRIRAAAQQLVRGRKTRHARADDGHPHASLVAQKLLLALARPPALRA